MFAEGPRRVGYEIVIAPAYEAQITRWLTIQPDAQCIIRPGTTGDLETAFVPGGRISIIF